jgi:Transposase DDE domain
VTVTGTDRSTGAVTTRTELFRLITSILDPQIATAADLAATYHARWESENSFRELKTFHRGPRTVLRSTDPDGVYQELYSYLITHPDPDRRRRRGRIRRPGPAVVHHCQSWNCGRFRYAAVRI